MKRLRSIATVGVVLIALLCGAAVYLVLDDVTDRLAAAERRADTYSKRLDAANTAVDALGKQVRTLGEDPVLEPADVPPDTDVVVIPGQKGDRGESCIEEIGYPRCRGAAGREGTAGADGADSTEPGPPGAPGKDGTNGSDGKDGAPGADGRGIRDLQCGDDGHWAVTYSDGTTSDGGVCRVAPGNSGENR